MPSRTTSSLTCHVITSVFSLITFTRRKRGLPTTQPLCVSEDYEDEDVMKSQVSSLVGFYSTTLLSNVLLLILGSGHL